MTLHDVAESNGTNDRAIQMALREVDEPLMVDWLVSVSAADREIIYRNMSERARDLLKIDIKTKEGQVTPASSDEAGTHFMDLVERFYLQISK